MNVPPSSEMSVRAAELSRRSLMKFAMAIGAAGYAGVDLFQQRKLADSIDDGRRCPTEDTQTDEVHS